MNRAYQKTIAACFIGYIVQAIVNNFVPLLFVMFRQNYQIPMSQITLLITLNFLIQLLVDGLSTGFIAKMGYRFSIVLAHVCAAAGLILLTFLPDCLPNPFIGILIPVMVYALGGGLTEVLLSPIMEACPTENKEAAMSLLHSFYCWGFMGVVAVSTAFFALFGISHWRILALIWACIPAANGIFFSRVPIQSVDEGEEEGLGIRGLFSKRIFWLLMLMMMCAGASEQAVSQWASTFAEEGLGLTKTVGDLAGPMTFAAMMGIARVIYGKFGEKMNLDRFMSFSCLLCLASYLCISLIPIPLVGVVGCAVCGFSVAILWPGTFSKASAVIKGGGTAMFAMLALAGDVGCSGGPTLAGFMAERFGDNLRLGILGAIIFPILMLVGVLTLSRSCAESR